MENTVYCHISYQIISLLKAELSITPFSTIVMGILPLIQILQMLGSFIREESNCLTRLLGGQLLGMYGEGKISQ